jgi:hypothetical protein
MGQCRVRISGITAALVASGCGTAVDSPVSDLDAPASLGRSTQRATLSSGRTLPENAVLGVMQRVVAGRVVESVALPSGLSAGRDISQLIDSGQPDEEGFVYKVVEGAQSDGDNAEFRYQYVDKERLLLMSAEARAPKPGLLATVPLAPLPRVGKKLAAIVDARPDTLVRVDVNLKGAITTKLEYNALLSLASLGDAAEQHAKKHAAIHKRKNEASTLQAPLVSYLNEVGAKNVAGSWSVNVVSATIPARLVRDIASRADVLSIDAVVEPEDDSATDWDGADMKAASGLNTGAFHDNGYNGQASTPKIRVGIIGAGFQEEHPGFIDNPGGYSRVQAEVDCLNNPCTSPGRPTSGHAQRVAGLAVGSIRQHQLAGRTAQQELEQSGVAEEVDIWLLSYSTSDGARRAIEFGIDDDVDVIISSSGIFSAACDGLVASSINVTVYQAQMAGTLYVQSAGNGWDGINHCTLNGVAEGPSVFAVGSAGEDSNDCTSTNWSSATPCGISSWSDYGGLSASTGGTTYAGALSIIAAVAPGCPFYGFTTSGDTDAGAGQCGTSFASPQVGGAAALLKDYFVSNGYGSLGVTRLFTPLLAMTDRWNGSGRVTTGFDPHWGGGRFQSRFFSSADMGAPWGWEAYTHTLSQGQSGSHPLFGSGAEPSGLQQLKVYGFFLEEDNVDIADIDLYVSDDTTGATLGQDTSRDVKSMVRLGAVGGHPLRATTGAFYVPSGQSRQFTQVAYYSNGTAMR